MASAQIAWGEKQKQLPWIGDITPEELAKHNKPEDCWCSFKGDVYNMTPYLSMHPGGPKIIMSCAGADMTELFMKKHPYISPALIAKIKIGRLVK
ncbi:Cytochrome b5-like Heme/Steroid binding domain containing protein [Trichomonas vaginalis G3]|uniref:Cytochrome b5-like Heme/Steroid binding domain containing protein n=1 Tax=Trichomonas vaginalis (strain ATCC PRA-98 / G3) TaxID=412133 RepID=A2FNG8_TRIV3|nr:oxidoreductase activity, acting on NAD(P)H, heme protein as acceptor [Trichomonas vaginalis G3]EAX93542.1 Cytochrome b5-like Heme/Steroid binding domain containing protein [Trichomonas vaginalis G3]KAI5503777.1 oxidoreductase activity, acting on NAD(P)H, heme protein as acceptor [Trichomonas vaginalis G3]|eukprot:XP_001306472.1 Cytochrome b5-like Heme/Steroid binding domain containing protein [Trichomonas vaginalis G3]